VPSTAWRIVRAGAGQRARVADAVRELRGALRAELEHA
jgi:hypothetical protein